jgi:hypothetical protein
MYFYRVSSPEEKSSQAQEFIERVTELANFHTPKCYDIVMNETHAEFRLQTNTI